MTAPITAAIVVATGKVHTRKYVVLARLRPACAEEFMVGPHRHGGIGGGDPSIWDLRFCFLDILPSWDDYLVTVQPARLTIAAS